MLEPKHTKMDSNSSIMQIMSQRQSIGTFNSSPLCQLQSCNVDQPPNTPPSLPKFCDEVDSPMKIQFLDNPTIATIMPNELHTTKTLNNTLEGGCHANAFGKNGNTPYCSCDFNFMCCSNYIVFKLQFMFSLILVF